MELLNLIKSRRSVRDFKDTPIPRDTLQHIMEAGIWAPSSMNGQPWRFVIVDKPERLKEVATEAKIELIRFLQSPEALQKYGKANCERFMPRANAEDGIFYNAPALVFVISTSPSEEHFDHGLATENILLAAHGFGIGSCCIGLAGPLNNSAKARALFGMSAHEKLVIGIVLGYPSKSTKLTERKTEVVKWVD